MLQLEQLLDPGLRLLRLEQERVERCSSAFSREFSWRASTSPDVQCQASTKGCVTRWVTSDAGAVTDKADR